MKYFTLVLVSCLCGSIVMYGHEVTNLLEEWEQLILQGDKSQAQYHYNQIKETLSTSSSSNKIIARTLFRVYAKYVMYGLDGGAAAGHIDFAKVYYYAKQSADLGDKEALTLVGVLTTFKMDGTFNIVSSLESRAKHLRNEQQKQQWQDHDATQLLKPYQRVESYAKYHHLSAPLIDLYFAALQGSDDAALILGFKYMKGLGTDTNCSNSALFMQPILQKHFIEHPNKEKVIFQNRRIDHILYNTETFTLSTQWLDQEHIHIFEQIQQVTRDSITDVLTLAYNYLYGINGVQRNYDKAYELFAKVAQDTQNPQSMAFMAQMIVEGIAPIQDQELAFKLFQDSAKMNDSRGLNGLGYMYLNGLGTEKNIKKALKYFQKSSELGNADGHYNYGSLFMMPSTKEVDRNKRLAYTHLNVASAQGHAMAQYALSLIFLDGVDFFYSCELAVKLMHQASTRLPSANHVKQGNELFAKNKYPQAFAHYLQASLLGHNSAIVNAAILASEFAVIANADIDYHNLNHNLLRDDLYAHAKLHHYAPIKQDPFGYLFADYISIMGERQGDVDYATRYQHVRELTHTPPTKQIGAYIANKLFGYCKLELDGFCYLRYGDFYYEGVTEEQNYIEAFNQYMIASEAPDTPAVIQGHAYFNMGYIVCLGLGLSQNTTLARHYFNESLSKHPLLPGVTADVVLNLIQLFGQPNKGQFIERFDLLLKQSYTSLVESLLEYHKQLLMSILLVMFVFAYGAKLKAQNLMQ